MHYVTVFDAAQVDYRHWWGPFIPLFIGIMFPFLGKFSRKRRPELVHLLRPLYINIASIVLILASMFGFYHSYSEYAQMREALTAKNYHVVEGRVSNYVPEMAEDHHAESFEVSGHKYSYHSSDDTAGYTQTYGFGGLIREGQQVRIADVDGQIARLEIAK